MAKIYSHTTGLCSICTQKVAARIIERDGAIYLEKMCPEHGATKALVSSDVAWYEESQHYIKPGQQPLMRNITEFTDCPDSCGYCPEHQQHVCLPVIEVLSHCDMQCPICMKRFAAPFALTAEEFTGIIDNLIRTEGCVDVINISGGEPTLHPQFKELIEIALEKGITQISVSTNGLTLLKDAVAAEDSPVVISRQPLTMHLAASMPSRISSARRRPPASGPAGPGSASMTAEN